MLWFKLIKKTLNRKLLLVWRCKISTNRVNHLKVRAYMTPETVHHWHGTNHWRAPTQSISNEAHSLTCIHEHNKQRVHTNIHIPKDITHIDSQSDMFTCIKFIMLINIRLCMWFIMLINIRLCMWWTLNKDIIMLTITFIL